MSLPTLRYLCHLSALVNHGHFGRAEFPGLCLLLTRNRKRALEMHLRLGSSPTERGRMAAAVLYFHSVDFEVIDVIMCSHESYVPLDVISGSRSVHRTDYLAQTAPSPGKMASAARASIRR